MKRILLVTVFALLAMPALFAQSSSSDWNHGYFGVFANYDRLGYADANYYGVGGRVGFNVHPHVALEAGGAYDWERNFGDVGTLPTGTARPRVKLVHADFGPKFQFGSSGPIRAFVFTKGGILNYSTNSTFTGTVSGVRTGDTNGVFYPGGGLEAYAGWFGIRGDVGDEMVFSGGDVHHNLRITIGPHIRF
jgi:hypothetical protein